MQELQTWAPTGLQPQDAEVAVRFLAAKTEGLNESALSLKVRAVSLLAKLSEQFPKAAEEPAAASDDEDDEPAFGKALAPPAAAASSAAPPPLSAGELEALRRFDLDSTFGPCVGPSRLQRWERAHGFGLNPPPRVKAILARLDPSDSNLSSIWEKRV